MKNRHDCTTTRRQSKRREQLNQKAQQLGFASWARFETMVLHGLHVEVKRERSITTTTTKG